MRATAATLVLLAIVGSCSGDDTEGPPPSGSDAPSSMGTPDASSSGGADSSPIGTSDAASTSGACAEPGAMGNDEGVGKYCTAGGNECQGNGSATYCTVDFEASAPPFCTMICFGAGDCGMNATCESMGGLSGCAPACLTAP